MFRVLLALVVTSVAAAAQAPVQPPKNPFGESMRKSTNHLTVEATVGTSPVSPGSRVSLSLDVTPRRTMHLYAPGKHDYQVVAFALDAQPWMSVQPTSYPPSEIYHFEPLDEKVEVYSKPFRLTREVTILSTPAARKLLAGRTSVPLTGTLEYQACDDKVCYSPTKVPLTFTLTLKP